MRILNILLIMLAALLISACSDQKSPRYVEINAAAMAKAAPEIVNFTFAISERGMSLDKLKHKIDTKTARVIALARGLGIKDQDMSSAEIDISPDYDYRTKRFLGYTVSRTVTATLRDLKLYTSFINGAIRSGISTISNINLDISERGGLEDRAMKAAIERGREKAGIIAAKGGVQLGALLSVQEHGTGEAVHSNYRAKRAQEYVGAPMTADKSVDAFVPGEIMTYKAVTMRYAIK